MLYTENRQEKIEVTEELVKELEHIIEFALKKGRRSEYTISNFIIIC